MSRGKATSPRAFSGALLLLSLCCSSCTPRSPRPPAAASQTKVPALLHDAGEAAEEIYDLAKAGRLPDAAREATSLKDMARRLPAEIKVPAGTQDRLQASLAALDHALTAGDARTAMIEANLETWIMAELTAPFAPTVPVEVTRLDYDGRELEISAAVKDLAKLKAAAVDLRRAWNTVRPGVEARGGSNVSRRFEALVARVEAAETPDEYGRLATAVEDEVDKIEEVFEK